MPTASPDSAEPRTHSQHILDRERDAVRACESTALSSEHRVRSGRGEMQSVWCGHDRPCFDSRAK